MPTATTLPPDTITAKFNPLIRPYLVIYVGVVLAMTIIGLPLALIWFCGVGQWWARHYFDLLQCELNDRSLRFSKGILVQVEKTIPLENIQDVTFIEGPILRRFHLAELKFETAGQASAQANDMRLIGIIDAREFRNEILVRRTRLKELQTHGAAPAPAATAHDSATALAGIQKSLNEIVSLLKAKREP